jgi:hypothetical protein
MCGFCGTKVSSEKAYKYSHSTQTQAKIFICPACKNPTYFNNRNEQIPGFLFGNPVQSVPKELNSLYEEARKCTQNNCFTSAVLISRKILMNIAVMEGAKVGLSFLDYVNYLSNKNFVPPNGKHWIDYIRKKGNEANHEITIMNLDDAQKLIMFIEMLLKFIYEFPSLIKPSEEILEN